MLVDRRGMLLLPFAIAGIAVGPAKGADTEGPDSDFLEYLGSWEEGDEDWLAVAEWEEQRVNRNEARKPQGEKDVDQES